jgi:hypothetical protein
MRYIEDDSVKLTREELYEKVWGTPATKLAKEFDISDVALGKICKKLDIPRPVGDNRRARAAATAKSSMKDPLVARRYVRVAI